MSSYRCSDQEPKKYKVTFDGGSAGNDTWLLCSKHFNEPRFQKFILKIEELQ